MRNLTVLILLGVIFSGCQNKKMPDKLTAKQFRYAAYSWHYTDTSAFFYMAAYFEAFPDGAYRMMRRDTFMAQPQYFEGLLPDHISNYIDTAIVTKAFDSTYFFKPESSAFYDGSIYCLDYTDNSNLRKVVQFIPSQSPESIKKLSLLLDTIIFNPQAKATMPFKLDSYKDSLESIVRKSGQGPLPLTKQPPVIIIKK